MLDKLIKEYINGPEHKDHQAQIAFYKNLASIEEAIDKASFGMYMVDGRTYFSDHYMYAYKAEKTPKHWHISDLYRSRDHLLSMQIKGCKSFSILHGKLVAHKSKLPGIGDLLCYDISLRIGAYLDILPEKVYCQLGALVGYCKIMGLNPKEYQTLEIEYDSFLEMDGNFHHLSPHEIENFLCVMLKKLRAVI